jgi:hypothetical protein
MVQNKYIHVDVAFLTYQPSRCSDSPVVKQESPCIIGYEELRRHRALKKAEKDIMGEISILISLTLRANLLIFRKCRISSLQMVQFNAVV